MNDYSWLNSSAIAILGGKGSGKTALSYYLLDKMDRPVYVYDNPKPELVEGRGWHNLYRLETLYSLEGAAVWMDEPQISMPVGNKRANEGLQRLLSIARHRDITLMFSTCDTRWVTRALESYITAWIVKDVEPSLVKQGALIKKLIKNYVVADVDEFHLEPSEYLFYDRHRPELDRKHTFQLPTWFTDEHSKPYSLEKKPADVAPEPRPEMNGHRRIEVVSR